MDLQGLQIFKNIQTNQPSYITIPLCPFGFILVDFFRRNH